jgi:hypothetical protein
MLRNGKMTPSWQDGAHPDDIDVTCAGTLICYIKEGHKVYIAIARMNCSLPCSTMHNSFVTAGSQI